MTFNKIVAGMALPVLMLSCGSGDKQGHKAELTFNGDTVTIDAQSSIRNKIKLITLVEEPFCNEFRTVGTVNAENGRYAEVCLPFDGRITREIAHLGDKVRAGQCLLELSSSEFIEASKQYFQSVRSHKQAQAEYERKKELFDHGITSRRELDEAQTEAENARREKESAETTLRHYGMDPTQARIGQSVRVCSPIDGEVVECDITEGKFVRAEEKPLAIIADLRRVWVTARIKEHYIGVVNGGGQAEVFTDAAPDSMIIGKVYHVGNMVDEDTRSVQVVLECDNDKSLLKHGMFVSVHFMGNPHNSIVLPATAIFQGEQRSYVFVAVDKPDTYVRRQVEIEASSDDKERVSIRSGLKAGEKVIAVGGLYLND